MAHDLVPALQMASGMNEKHTVPCVRPLYPVRLLGDVDVIHPGIIKFGGVPFVRTTAGEWAMLDAASAVD